MMPSVRLLRSGYCKVFSVSSAANISSSCCNYATNRGNPQLININESEGLPERWKRTWFLTMKRKAEIEGPENPMPRSNQRNWSYKAELNAFQVRLGLKCSEELLHIAFCDPAPDARLVEDNMKENQDNQELAGAGRNFAEMFLTQFTKVAFPSLPFSARKSIEKYVLQSSNVAHVAKNLGYEDFIQSLTYPPSDDTITACFFAVLEVINSSEGPVSAGRFLLDFLIPTTSGKDILDDIWMPKDPMKLLAEEMELRKMPLPEARLTKQSGINTVLPVFFVALFSGQRMLSHSGGESIPLAEADAAKLALKRLYRIHPSDNPIPMGVSVSNEFLKQLFEPLSKQNKNSDHLKATQTLA